MALVIVESPAKAKTIEKYLGPDYQVIATGGHLRDLSQKSGSVIPDEDFRMIWEVMPSKNGKDPGKRIRDIASLVKKTDRLLLATDPDREGEAIAWHLVEALKEKKALPENVRVERVSFNAVTKTAITDAISHPRGIDQELVNAYQARRALDYLFGFNLSPVLLRKIPSARSAGRVQSPALRLVVERQQEIEAFVPRQHWKIYALLAAADSTLFRARLVTLGGKKIGPFDLPDETAAREAERVLVEAAGFLVTSVEAKPEISRPKPPFITSSMQQAASSRLGMQPRRTMQAAQHLYENGLITYMRTDGLTMAPEAIAAVRTTLQAQYGEAYLPGEPRRYSSKAKNAQEAHECIRPTDPSCTPERAGSLKPDELNLYRLIWKRTMASQMPDAVFERTTALIDANDKDEGAVAGLRASGRVLRFDGHLKIYEDDSTAEGPPEAGEDEVSGKVARARDGRPAAAPANRLQPAFHRTTAAFFAGLAYQGARKAWHRKTFDLRLHGGKNSGTQLRRERGQAHCSHLSRPPGDRLFTKSLRRSYRQQFHLRP